MTLLRPAFIYQSIDHSDPEWDGQEVYPTGLTHTVGANTYVCVKRADNGDEGYVHPSELRRTQPLVPVGAAA